MEQGSHKTEQSLFKSLLGDYLTPRNSVDDILDYCHAAKAACILRAFDYSHIMNTI